MQPLFEVMTQSEIAGCKTIELQRTPRRKARKAELSVRYAHVWLQPPAHLGQLEPIEMWVVLAEEENPTEKEKPVRWLLLSTVAIKNFEDACECLRRYSLRWTIERYFHALQSGCRVEQLQLERGERLERAVATYSIVAWRLLWLMYAARRNPERTVEGILEPVEWRSLYLLAHRTKDMPSEAPTLGECVQWMAKLGGYLGRKGDGDPGIGTMWCGWIRVNEAAEVWSLMQPE